MNSGFSDDLLAYSLELLEGIESLRTRVWLPSFRLCYGRAMGFVLEASGDVDGLLDALSARGACLDRLPLSPEHLHLFESSPKLSSIEPCANVRLDMPSWREDLDLALSLGFEHVEFVFGDARAVDDALRRSSREPLKSLACGHVDVGENTLNAIMGLEIEELWLVLDSFDDPPVQLLEHESLKVLMLEHDHALAFLTYEPERASSIVELTLRGASSGSRIELDDIHVSNGALERLVLDEIELDRVFTGRRTKNRMPLGELDIQDAFASSNGLRDILSLFSDIKMLRLPRDPSESSRNTLENHGHIGEIITHTEFRHPSTETLQNVPTVLRSP